MSQKNIKSLGQTLLMELRPTILQVANELGFLLSFRVYILLKLL